ncbi:MAG: GH3 auxin-responsive promoter family protein [Bacteroidales bacterium]|nr:GH3 auxin-responsive promoter family protein [Candidatus Hennigimonas equi]
MSPKDRTVSLVVNTGVGVKGGPEISRLRQACTFPRITQTRTLRSILENARNTEYGKEHNFGKILEARSEKELYSLFRKYNKPAEYEDFRPYVERMMHGEADILFPGRPLMYATTSGSSAAPKFVPISDLYLNGIYRKMSLIWMYSFMLCRSKVFSGKVFTVVGKQTEGVAPDGIVMGSVSSYTNRSTPKLVQDRYIIPSIVYTIDDYATRNYVLMRLAIEQNVTLYVTPNPSTVVELQNVVDKWLDEFINDIGNGTLTDRLDIPAEVREAVAPMLKPNHHRAFELRALQSQYERVLPKHFWPDLQILCTWKCGNTSIYLKHMADFFPENTCHLELGYFSTECRAGLAIEEGIDSVLMPHMHFYEFKKEKDMDNPKAPFYCLHELKQGERYCPFVTTFSGLYRYSMNDIVQAGSDFINTPRIHMVRKANGIVSITGEKLYEEQFINAVDQAQESTKMKLRYYSGYVNLSKGCYDWYFEFENRRVTQRKANAFAAVVDGNLKKLNMEYESKRNSFRLKNPEVFLLQRDSFQKFKEFILNRNHRDASRFKPNVLAQNEEHHSVIHKLRQTGIDIEEKD